jgi:FAD/FMN-containing dehydrogenase
LQRLFDPLYPPGLQWYWRGDFFREVPPEAIALHLDHAAQIPTPLSGMHMYPVDGAVHRRGSGDTAFAYRDVHWSQVVAGIDPDPSNAEVISRWSKEYSDALHPHAAGGAYLNFIMAEGDARIRAGYRDNYDRLTRVKRAYDPTNLFRINQNIPPAS